jgi:L-cysteine:1D-myo-inositol 2-amino-2-deoxy-alpha-D-glucopyranoside ligase
MRLFDTARQAVVPFEPRGNRVGIYVCGITPYDAAHLGHAFTYHVFDVLTRRLQSAGLTVQMVRNITDVDDDILRVSRERGVDYRTLAAEQVTRFDTDMSAIGLLPVGSAPRASAHVPEMARWVSRLQGEDFAYERDGWVYFDTQMFPDYGRLSRLDVARMIELSRERGADPDDPRKRNPLDFVLWQRSAPGEPSWESPWGMGRPGWHIECSVLSTGELGIPIDIHGGGDDLIYPHHESEIAQAEAAGVAPYVRHWVHVAMVRLAGVKMSKSLGNLIFVSDLVRRSSGDAVRLMLAMHHFRSGWEFDDEELHGAVERLRRYDAAMTRGGVLPAGEAAAYEREFLERIDDDLDTPGALHVLDRTAEALARATPAPVSGDAVSGEATLHRMLAIVGLRLPSAVA